MAYLDFTYLKKFRGYLGWNSFTNGKGQTIPQVEVEMYLSSLAVPTRKPKITEHVSTRMVEPATGVQLGGAALFYGAPDLLQMELSGWMLTSQSNRKWIITDTSGTALNPTLWGNIPYPEVVNAYLSGKVNVNAAGTTQRKDPDYYVSPQGFKYLTPIIQTFSSGFTVNAKKQTFQMTMLLET